MNVLVTGAEGFIGSHLVEDLVRRGHKVKALCLYNSFSNIGWLSELPTEISKEVELVFGDVNDSELISTQMAHQEQVFNLAALIAIPYSYKAPRSYVQTNVVGALNILEAARANATHVIQISTSEVYGNPETTPITENHSLKPQSPYAASKSSADLLALAHHATYGIPVTVVRPFNTYGPRQSMRAVIPTILSQFIEGKKVIHLGNLETKRDFTFVKDTCKGILDIAKNIESIGEVTQLGTGEVVSVSDIVSVAKELTGMEVEVQSDRIRIRPEASEITVLHSDPTKARSAIGWNPQVNLKEGLGITLAWIRENSSKLGESGRYHI